jgi:hypothetical protein
MVRVLQSEPFYKPNVLAMLNTLFPPTLRTTPSKRISLKDMHKWRAKFYSYIAAVERDGKQVMNMFVDKLEQTEERSWKDVHRRLECYFHDAEFVLGQVTDPHGPSNTICGERLSTEIRTISTYISTSDSSSTGSSSITSSIQFPPFATNKADLASQESGNAEVWKMQHHGSRNGYLADSLPKYNGHIAKHRPRAQSMQTSQSVPVGFPTSRPASRAATLPIPRSHKFVKALRALRNFSSPRTKISPQISPSGSPNEPTWEGKWVTIISRAGETEIEWIPAPEPTPVPIPTPISAPGSGKTLLSDNFDFLNHPYEDPFPDLPNKLRKKFSTSRLFSRSRNGSSTSLNTDCDEDNASRSRSPSLFSRSRNGSSTSLNIFSRSRKSSSTSLRANYHDENALGITMHPDESTVALPDFAKQHQTPRRAKLSKRRVTESEQALSRSSLKSRQGSAGALDGKQTLKPLKKARSLTSLFARKEFAESTVSVMSLQEVYTACAVGPKGPPRSDDDDLSIIPIRPTASPARASSLDLDGEPLQKVPTLRSLISAEDDSEKLPLPPNFNAGKSSSYNVEYAASSPEFYQEPRMRQIPPKRLTELKPLKNHSKFSPAMNANSSEYSRSPEIMQDKMDKYGDVNKGEEQRVERARRERMSSSPLFGSPAISGLSEYSGSLKVVRNKIDNYRDLNKREDKRVERAQRERMSSSPTFGFNDLISGLSEYRAQRERMCSSPLFGSPAISGLSENSGSPKVVQNKIDKYRHLDDREERQTERAQKEQLVEKTVKKKRSFFKRKSPLVPYPDEI